MSPPQVFLLDANVFMEAARRYYALDIAPGFWDALIEHARNGRVRSIDKIKGEIDRGKDNLKRWANGSFSEWFDSTNQQDVIDAYSNLMIWAQRETQYTAAAKAEFASSPDGWLIAYASAKGCVVVTHEQYDSEIKKKIKIPNACRGVGVRYTNTFHMLRELGVRLNFPST